MSSIAVSLTLILLLALNLAESIHYVRPASPSGECPAQPCLLLNQYTANSSRYFTTGATFLFLPGNHTLSTSLHLTATANISLRAAETNSSLLITCTQGLMLDNVSGLSVVGLTFSAQFADQGDTTGKEKMAVFVFQNCEAILIMNAEFRREGADHVSGRAIHSTNSIITITNCLFEANSGVDGGAIYAESNTVLNVDKSYFTGNLASRFGGAIYVRESVITLTGNNFSHNSGNMGGGAIYCSEDNQVTLSALNHFDHNSVARGVENTVGGAIGMNGGGSLTVRGPVTFTGNRAARGGAISLQGITIKLVSGNVSFEENIAERRGGAVNVETSSLSCDQANHLMFIHNTALLEGSESAGGGGLFSISSELTLSGSLLFENNSGFAGGALHSELGSLNFCKKQKKFVGNRAEYGGGLYASSTNINVGDNNCPISFSFNSAQSGGAMYFVLTTIMTFQWYQELNTHGNKALQYGGAIYYKDSISNIQCTDVANILQSDPNLASTIPYSFLQINKEPGPAFKRAITKFNSLNDIAGIDGDFMYGGLLDRSRLISAPNTLPYEFFIFNITRDNSATKGTNCISSQPFLLMFCGTNQTNSRKSVTVHRGQTFSFGVMAFGQGNSSIPTTVTASFHSSARLSLNQSAQEIKGECSNVTYNFYSSENHEELTIYPEGPCETIGEASAVISVVFLPCPNAFNQLNEECVCEDRLRELNATCTIDDESIQRYTNAKFWLNASYHKNGSYEGLILASSCPADFCTSDAVAVHLDDPDSQCAFNRSGTLCGACAEQYSLLLGSSQCRICSNIHILLIVPFALAGLFLIAVLSFLRLTVATGAINSLILYANFVHVNKKIFLSNRTNFLTVLLAWVNFDLGFELCFFDGMDMYARTSLQFLFPLYIWILISLIALWSRYSSRVSKLIGPEPIAILATLLLMSYSKVLKVIIETFSFTTLEYPNGKQVTVWQLDGNLPHFHAKHLLLSVFASLFLVLVFIPYTLFVFFGYFLYRLPCRKYYFWLIIRLKPFLDAHYAPYRQKTRFWTGLLLSIRCILYAVFSLSSSPNHTLLAIIVSFTAIGSITWLTKGIYRNFYVDIVEISVYMNLVVLSAATATLSEASQEVVTYLLIGAVLATTVGVAVRQIYLRYCAKFALCTKIRSKIKQQGSKSSSDSERAPLFQPDTAVSRTVVAAQNSESSSDSDVQPDTHISKNHD